MRKTSRGWLTFSSHNFWIICDTVHIDSAHSRNSLARSWCCSETSWDRAVHWAPTAPRTIIYPPPIPLLLSCDWSTANFGRLIVTSPSIRSGKAWSGGSACRFKWSCGLIRPASVGFDRWKVRDWVGVDPPVRRARSWGKPDQWTAPIVYFFRIENLTIAISPFFDSLLKILQRHASPPTLIIRVYIEEPSWVKLADFFCF